MSEKATKLRVVVISTALIVLCAAALLGLAAVGMKFGGKPFADTVFVAFFIGLIVSACLNIAGGLLARRERRKRP